MQLGFRLAEKDMSNPRASDAIKSAEEIYKWLTKPDEKES